MTTTARIACPECGYENERDALACSMCGRVTRPEREPEVAPRRRPPRTPRASDPDTRSILAPPPPANRMLGMPPPLFYLVAGLVAAPVFGLTPILGFMGWFFAGLVHEMGHAATGWFFGCPAFPAIRLDGHAAALHGPQVTLLAITVWVGLGATAWRLRARHGASVPLGLLTLLYPALAFTNGRELVHLLGGHLGELTIATVFFWRALSGGFTHSRLERGLYALMAWFLLIRNLQLTLGLAFSTAARADYHGSGSFGLTNDYIRVANELLGVPLQTVAAGMTLVALAVVPAAIVGWRWGRRPGEAPRATGSGG